MSMIPPVEELHPEPPEHPLDDEPDIDWNEAKKEAEAREEVLSRVLEPSSPAPLETIQDLDRELSHRAGRVDSAFAREKKLKREKELENQRLAKAHSGLPLSKTGLTKAFEEIEALDPPPSLAGLSPTVDPEIRDSHRTVITNVEGGKEIVIPLSELDEKAIAAIESPDPFPHIDLDSLVGEKKVSRKLSEGLKKEFASLNQTIEDQKKAIVLLEGTIDYLEKEAAGLDEGKVDSLKNLSSDLGAIEKKTEEAIREYERLERERDRYKSAHKEVLERWQTSENRVDRILKLMSKLIDAVEIPSLELDETTDEEADRCSHCGTRRPKGETCPICQK